MSRGTVIWAAICVVVTAIAATAVTVAPAVLVIIPAMAAAWALRWPSGRLLWLVIGGLIVLQSTSGLNGLKLGYLAGVVVAAAIAMSRWQLHIHEPWAQPFRRVAQGGRILGALLVLAAAVGFLQGSSLTDIGRDGLTYALILAGPPIALDAAATLRPRAADRLVIVVSLLATVGFATAWISRRDVSQVEVQQFLLASNSLMAIGVALAATRGLVGDRIRWLWLAAVPVIIAGQLVTGTRTGAVLILGVLGIVGARRKGRAPLLRSAIGGLAMLGALLVLLPLVSSRLTSRGFLEERLLAAQQVLSGGLGNDQSGSIRQIAYRVANDIWQQHQLFGVGLGAYFPDPNHLAKVVPYQIDASTLVLAKFGLVGVAVLLLALARIFSPVKTASRLLGERIPEQAVIRGFLAVMLGLLLFIPPTEDKGFALSVPLLLLLVGCSLRERLAAVERSAGSEPQLPTGGDRQAAV